MAFAKRRKIDSSPIFLIRKDRPMEAFRDIFGGVEDPRSSNAQHDLVEVIFIALLAVLCGGESCTDMEEFGYAKEDFLQEILELKHGIPSHDTFSRIFRLLDPESFSSAFQKFTEAFSKALPNDVIALDGKAVKSAFDRGKRFLPPMIINAWAVQSRLVLSQHLADNRNETAAAIDLLKMLDVKGSTVTADALHCNRKFAQTVLDGGGEYVLTLKGNQFALMDHTPDYFENNPGLPTAATREKSHDRQEVRTATVYSDPSLAEQFNFPGLTAVGRIESQRDTAEATHYYALSKPMSPEQLLTTVRAHWTIENQLHWVLDVILKEDENRSRKDHAPENIALLRKMALNMLRASPDKASIRRKIKKAGWNNKFLLSLLFHMR